MNIKRYYIDGDKPGSKNGYEIVSPGGTIIRGSWKTGDREIINTQFRTVTKFEIAEKKQKKLIKKERHEYKLKALQNRINSCVKAYSTIEAHPYLAKKRLTRMYDSLLPYLYNDSLLIPIFDIFKDKPFKLQTAQYIDKDGNKRFESGLSIGNGVISLFVNEKDCGYPVKKIYICEGYATGITIRVLTGDHVICALSAQRIPAIYKLTKFWYQKDTNKIIIAADNDEAGLRFALKSECPNIICPPFPGMDFNDLLIEKGDSFCKEVLTMS